MTRRGVIGLVLALGVLASGWLALSLRDRGQVDAFIGPPRPDYTMDDYRLVVLDAGGAESFSVSGPLLARDPFTAEITLERPLFEIPSEQGLWTARSQLGWVSAGADELRLDRDVELDGPPEEGRGPARVRTRTLTIHPEPRTAHSHAHVRVDRGTSILEGTGLDAELDTRRLQLHSDVRIRHEPQRR